MKCAPLLAAVTVVLIASTAGCVRGCRNTPPAPQPTAAGNADTPGLKSAFTPVIKKDTPLFGFDYEAVTEFLIVKADPATGDRFAAHLSRPDLHSDEWKITNAGGGAILLDQKADGYFILHLLDTLRTLRVGDTNAVGPLESLGLSPPRFALQWKSGDQQFEVRLGAPLEDGKSVYAWVPNQPAFIANGSTLQMLDYMNSFVRLRLQNWTGVTADDVDEIQIAGQGGASFYAQREGSVWKDRAHKRLRADVDSWLERIVHQRVLNFVDDTARADALKAQVDKAPLRKAVLKDRHNHSIELKIARIKDRWIGISSGRPQGVFEVYPESLKAMDRPK